MPVVDALPWFEVPVVGRQITIHDLLTHTAGITGGIDGTPDAAFQVWALRDRRPGSTPGERFHYSNLGYKTLGLVIEAVEGRPYPEAVRTLVLEPLRMTATEPAIIHDIRPRLAVGYAYLHDDRIGYPGRPLAPATWVETATADGAIASTAVDIAALARMLLRRGEGPDGRLLSEASFARMAKPHARSMTGYGYGYGLATRVLGGRTFLGHGGGMIGYLSALQVDPAAELAAVILQNGLMGSPMALDEGRLSGRAHALASIHCQGVTSGGPAGQRWVRRLRRMARRSQPTVSPPAPSSTGTVGCVVAAGAAGAPGAAVVVQLRHLAASIRPRYSTASIEAEGSHTPPTSVGVR